MVPLLMVVLNAPPAFTAVNAKKPLAAVAGKETTDAALPLAPAVTPVTPVTIPAAALIFPAVAMIPVPAVTVVPADNDVPALIVPAVVVKLPAVNVNEPVAIVCVPALLFNTKLAAVTPGSGPPQPGHRHRSGSTVFHRY